MSQKRHQTENENAVMCVWNFEIPRWHAESEVNHPLELGILERWFLTPLTYVYTLDVKDCFWDRSSRGTVFGDQRRKTVFRNLYAGVRFGSQVLSPATSPGRWLVTWIYPIPPQTHHGETILILNFKHLWTSLDLWYPKSSTLLVDGVCVCVTKKMRLKLLATIPQKNGWFDLQVFSYLVI